MFTSCLNCHHSFKGKFCPNCGQKASVKRLTAAELLKDIIHFLTHLESGFLFTTWSFLIRPGIASLEYIAGKRKEYQTPVSYFLIWTGLYILIHNAIINYYHYQITNEIISSPDMLERSNILFRRHFSMFIIPLIILSAIILYYIMAKPQYNFTEILICCLYGGGTYFMMCLISDCILGFLFKVNILTTNVFLWQTILSALYNFWVTYDLFKRLRLRLFWLRLFGASVLVSIGGWLIMIYLPLAWLYFTKG
jgi:hypothetical protein